MVSLFVLCSTIAWTAATASATVATVKNPPKPVLSHYVSSSDQVTSERSVQLTHTGPAQVVVTYEGAQPNSQGSTSRDLIILSWDHFAKRWVVVFDGAKTVPPNGSSTNLAQNAVLPSGADVFKFAYAPITSAKGETDLAFWSTYNFGANGFLEASIVHYNGQVASLSYYTEGVPGQELPSVIGTVPHQKLSVPEAWLTSVDPECCAVRTYTDTVSYKTLKEPGGYKYKTYVVTKSTQSWLGVYVATYFSTDNGPPPDPTVLSVIKGGPAAGILQVGDQLVNVAGDSTSDNGLLGPAVVDEVAKSLPGTAIAVTTLRDGTERVVNIKLGSTASPAFTNSSAPVPGYMGVEITQVTPQLQSQYGLPVSTGVLIDSVISNSPADDAGLVSGDVITSFGSTPVATLQDLQDAANLTPPGTTVQITYADGTDTGQTTSVTMGAYPTDTPGPQVFSM
jgi:hypothetical protein